MYNPFGTIHYLPPEGCSGEALIEMKGIVKTFKNAAGEFTALKGITACFYAGEFVSIVGKSGSGKSTLVNMLTGIDHPTSGSVRVEKTFIHKMSENDMSLWRGQNLGIVFQFFQLMPTLTLLENVMLPMELSGSFKPAERERRALDLLGLVGLREFAQKLPAAVSGGQQQSVAIARALANDPPILIADEPTGNLDSRSADEIFDLFAGLIEQGKTILMVTHDPSLAKKTARTLLLADGELVNPWVAQAFPDLSHAQMLWLTHHLRSLTQPASALIAGREIPPIGIYLLVGGELELVQDGNSSHDPVITRLMPGEYLTSLDFEEAGSGKLTARVGAGQPAELYALDDLSFRKWLNETPTARSSLEKLAKDRAVVLNRPIRRAERDERA